jgi:hypothetical protein
MKAFLTGLASLVVGRRSRTPCLPKRRLDYRTPVRRRGQSGEGRAFDGMTHYEDTGRDGLKNWPRIKELIAA